MAAASVAVALLQALAEQSGIQIASGNTNPKQHFKQTRLCRYYQNGDCKQGKDCDWAHSQDDFYKTKLCQDWVNGWCTMRKACTDAHGKAELRTFAQNRKTTLEQKQASMTGPAFTKARPPEPPLPAPPPPQWQERPPKPPLPLHQQAPVSTPGTSGVVPLKALLEQSRRITLKCATSSCVYYVNTLEEFNGYCCRKCHSHGGGVHGHLCERRAARPDAERAPPKPPVKPMAVQKQRAAMSVQAATQEQKDTAETLPKQNPLPATLSEALGVVQDREQVAPIPQTKGNLNATLPPWRRPGLVPAKAMPKPVAKATVEPVTTDAPGSISDDERFGEESEEEVVVVVDQDEAPLPATQSCSNSKRPRPPSEPTPELPPSAPLKRHCTSHPEGVQVVVPPPTPPFIAPPLPPRARPFSQPEDTSKQQLTKLLNDLRAEVDVICGLTGSRDQLMARCSQVDFPDIPDAGRATKWLRIVLDQDLEIQPRLQCGQQDFSENALQDGKPSTTYHGTYGTYALNIIKERNLRMGHISTRGVCGIWHGPPITASRYAWPTVWPKCTQPTMAMFEMKVSAQKKHANNVYVSQWKGSFEVSALLLSRHTGSSLAEEQLRREGFLKLRNGVDASEPAGGDVQQGRPGLAASGSGRKQRGSVSKFMKSQQSEQQE
eukprot:TRINITY_DN27130_c0_g2_i1.p1 TRINITY_DN27130_c0_g2~~TRINITY_DN27130_c0_g2_i1.p1  ORF type:complete len:662 (-),score=138.15 TRINITY_DN27130_c0_g2_i1:65-2050(-)